MAAKRSIFEDVGTEKREAPPVARTGVIDRAHAGARGAIRLWLIVLFALVVAMIAVGGLTRLTDAGLSITEWAPVTGAIPPMSDEAWQGEFAKYQQIPEFALQNSQMTLDEFRGIYWWEWGHRQLGRLVGLVWALGLGYFLLRRQVPTGWTWRLVLPGLLGGLQGAVGWWMVSSGLGAGMVDVAPYRLAIHLELAFVILGVLAWHVMQLSRPDRVLMQARRLREARLWRLTAGLAGALLVQVLLGALVAGNDAGRNFNDWPLMAGGFFPPDPFQLSPIWRNFFEDPGLVQFVHRMVGYGVFLFGLFVWWQSRSSAHLRTRRAFDWMMVMIFGQAVLGVVAVLTQAQAHVALTHQLVAVAVWVLVLRARHMAGYPVVQSVRERK
ncbi:heme A synthase [Tropicimonas sp. IMCC34043]|uniref:heme A synthase n=1 Tax=Tropicimonas sp. IMCC34043 TaxID=2248760 RepID=UPI000E2302F6|nr:heme A synthase [Tropicimonas sp. IMCC34043]